LIHRADIGMPEASGESRQAARNNEMVDLTGKRLGFVGTGDIVEAVITGICNTDLANMPIVVSPRNATIAARLAEKHSNVSIGSDNQDVLDRSNIVVLAVLPQIIEDVTRALNFRPDHHVISFAAATSLENLRHWIGQSVSLSQAIPLPFVAGLNGATAIHPRDEISAAIFSRLGKAVEVDNKREYDSLAAAGAVMGTYFGMLDTLTLWLERQGLPYKKGGAYLGQLFAGLGQAAGDTGGKRFSELRDSYSTTGGLNEQVHRDFARDGGNVALESALDAVFKRIAGG
jgi:pyrroline-5-carboxylate reductase